MIALRRSLLFVALLLSRSAIGSTQTARGVVVDRNDAPLPGVVLQLLDSTSAVAARALSNERGEFRLSIARPGTYRIRTLRIGYRPFTTEPVVLASGADVTQRLVLSGLPISLDTMRVADRNVCRAFTDSGAATFAVWQQVRTALSAAQLTAAARVILATTVTYERTLDSDARRVREQHSRVESEYVRQPWLSLAPDSLRRTGYVVTDRDNSTIYYAPGIDMLLSDGFVEDHCFRLKAERTRVGIEFEPAPQRKGIPEIGGVLWVDRASSELRGLEYRYANLGVDPGFRAGGDLDFAHLANGMWAITRWKIQMPVVENRVRSQALGGSDTRVTAVRVSGGDLVLARRGKDTLWSRPPLMMAGVVLDSVSGAPVAGARIGLFGTQLQGVADARGHFTVDGVLPGEYTLDVRTPSLDSVGAMHRTATTFLDSATTIRIRAPNGGQIGAALCGNARLELPGIVVGTVNLRGDPTSLRGTKIVAQWNELAVRGTAGGVTTDRRERWLETRADARGNFRLCGVPINTDLTVRAESDAASAEPVSIRIPTSGRVAHAEMTLDANANRGAILVGFVLTDSAQQQPIAGAEVSIPGAGKTVLSDARGAFRLTEIPPGTHRIVVRHIGYGALDTELSLAPRQTMERRIVLTRAVALDSVVVKSTVLDRRLQNFEENRKVGLGHFFTRDQLAKMEGRTTSSVLSEIPGLMAVSGKGMHAWIRSSRNPAAGEIASPESEDARMGARPATCYSQVYVDGTRVFSGNKYGNHGSLRFGPLFDVNSIAPDQIEAIEFYASPSQTPGRYSDLNSVCGVLVIHTRR